MSNYTVSDYQQRKPRRANKIFPQSIPRVPNTIRSGVSLINNAKSTENNKENLNMRLRTCPEGSSTDETDHQVPSWHTLLSLTFEGFLLKLDEIFTGLKKEQLIKASECFPVIRCYQNVCERLRLEILIALDKLDLLSSSKTNYSEKESEFLQRMGELKTQLSRVRLEYHKAVKDLGGKI